MSNKAFIGSKKKHKEQRNGITLIIEYDNAADLVDDYTANLSAGGTFVHTAREFRVGTNIELILSFPALLTPLRLFGVVCSTRANENETGVDIEFINHDLQARSRFEQIFKAIQAGDPQYVGTLIRVLLAEDNLHIAKLIREGLTQETQRQSFSAKIAFDFFEAIDGQEAVNYLELGSFELFIIDLFLPVLHGMTVIQRIKAHKRHRHVPVIAMSSKDKTAREQARAAGCDYFLDKPFRLRELIEIVRKTLVAHGKLSK